jgi:hypothetical protein
VVTFASSYTVHFCSTMRPSTVGDTVPRAAM